MSFETFVALRHLKSIRSRRRVIITTLIGIIGVGLGVAALVITLSVMNGYAGMIWDRQVSMNPHITVRKPYSERISNYENVLTLLSAQPSVVSVAPFIESQGYVLGRTTSAVTVTSGVLVRGVDELHLSEPGGISDYMVSGQIDLATHKASSNRAVYGMTIGRHLAEKLDATIGSDIRLLVAPKDAPMDQLPPLRRYVVTGIFDTGFYEFDAGLVFVSLAAAQRDLKWKNWITGMHLKLEDPFHADRVSVDLRSNLAMTYPNLFPTSWMYAQGNLYAWILLQKWASFIVLSLIVVVAGFNIVSILTMIVMERRREIGVLKTLGATPKRIGRIFIREGILIGGCGVLLGDILGFGVCWIQKVYAPITLSGDVYFINALPVAMSGSDFVMTSALALLLCAFFALFPSRRAARLVPVDAIRYE
ncbi:MAG: ABC transporter permease [Candidatus Latescibacteria bacterium]|jgi:lipoprotein-releasing system permease protein|nr:ABC transporter permease [Candidatus Latescibacterota bacterium]MBT4139298.1 ABC transporter permease [Candidatus Latescibacterota bacterium]MBT5833012.1 ABC transporter permease [Candidatus Latescibacterota bacterium]